MPDDATPARSPSLGELAYTAYWQVLAPQKLPWERVTRDEQRAWQAAARAAVRAWDSRPERVVRRWAQGEE